MLVVIFIVVLVSLQRLQPRRRPRREQCRIASDHLGGSSSSRGRSRGRGQRNSGGQEEKGAPSPPPQRSRQRGRGQQRHAQRKRARGGGGGGGGGGGEEEEDEEATDETATPSARQSGQHALVAHQPLPRHGRQGAQAQAGHVCRRHCHCHRLIVSSGGVSSSSNNSSNHISRRFRCATTTAVEQQPEEIRSSSAPLQVLERVQDERWRQRQEGVSKNNRHQHLVTSTRTRTTTTTNDSGEGDGGHGASCAQDQHVLVEPARHAAKLDVEQAQHGRRQAIVQCERVASTAAATVRSSSSDNDKRARLRAERGDEQTPVQETSRPNAQASTTKPHNNNNQQLRYYF